MKYTSAKNPQWVNLMEDFEGKSKIVGKGINLTVNFEGLGEMPFLAVENDCTEHGRELYKRAKAGEFGEIAQAE